MRWVWILLIGLVWGCSSGKKEMENPPYFDLNGLLETESQQLASGIEVQKTVELDGKKETQNLNDYTWAAEIDLMSQWDINRPAWRDTYRSDSLVTTPGKLTLVYTATKEDIPVREMKVFLTGEVTDSLYIFTRVSNPLHTTVSHYYYRPGSSFILEQTNQRRFGDDQVLRIEVKAKELQE